MRAMAMFVSVVMLNACGGNPSQPPVQSSATTEPRAASPAPSPSPDKPARDVAPRASASVEEPGPEAAAAVLRDYYAAIAAHEYERAYAMWGDGGKSSQQTLEQFRAGFKDTAEVRATVGTPDRIEGAAGSRYIKVPVEVRAKTTRGTAQHYGGHYVLRRAVVDGATDAQRAWHLDSARMAAIP
jgi:hypothetical protein